MKMIHIRLEGRPLKIPDSTTILALVAGESDPGLGLRRPIGALINNRLVPLDSNLHDQAEVRLLDALSPQARSIYRRGCTLMLIEATRRLYEGVRLVVGQSLGDGDFFDWQGSPAFDPSYPKRIQAEMEKMVAEDLTFEQERCGVQEALRRFTQLGMQDRVELLNTFWHETIRLVHLGHTIDIHHGPVPPSTGYLPLFGLSAYPPENPEPGRNSSRLQGLVLRFPDSEHPPALDTPPAGTTKLFTIHRESRAWNRSLGVENVGTLNHHVLDGRIDEMIRVAEGFHEKRITEIADTIVRDKDRVRIALIAGPSSSGKTTFLKRLSVQLRVNGLRPIGLSIDNYYVDREDSPRDENGEFDFESIEAIDLPLFNEQLVDLLSGKEVRTPRFSFESGTRMPEPRWRTMQLSPGEILIVEGIHGLNDRLTSQVPAEAKFKIYVSALTQLCLDDANRIHTTDLRLLRRLVRDKLFRGYSASSTLHCWPSVRRGEVRHIFPFQESTDEMFNTALPYEMAVLKIYAERFLLEVPQEDSSYSEVHRLMKFLSLFVGIFPNRVPQNSILREFIGGSTFQY
ncbi:MAG: nucleoside kinase [Deltaproteobacteria bacterium]|nr:nucleoside kinase [Deltaproteobacteria bacterium]